MDTSGISVAASIIAVVVSAAAAVLTQRSASRAATKSTETTSRTDIEKEAFERAKSFYTDTIDRQDRQITELEEDLAREKHERSGEVRALRERLVEDEREIGRLRVELDTAKRVLRSLRRRPDDTDI
jgi:predicted RNase H-like nuclease (RuvC/YqgF family)